MDFDFFCLQEIADARNIRNQLMVNFELATQYAVEPEERRRLLHFVVVGGGPTGVEFSAEFYDFLNEVVQEHQLHCYICSNRYI